MFVWWDGIVAAVVVIIYSMLMYIFMFVCFSLNICNVLRIRIGCMYVVALFSLCMVSFSVFVCWDEIYASWVRL